MGAEGLIGLGIQGVIAFVLVLIIKNNHGKEMKKLEQEHELEKQDIQKDILQIESHKTDVDKLCDKIDKMIDTIHELQVKDTQKTVTLQNGLQEVHKMYEGLEKKISVIYEKIHDVELYTRMCPNIPKLKEEKNEIL